MRFWAINGCVLISLAAGMPIHGEHVAAVPATGEGELDVTEVLRPPLPEIVRLVGETRSELPRYDGLPHTVAVDVSVPVPVAPIMPKAYFPASIPDDARWPDSNGRLMAEGIRKTDAKDPAPVRNPWEAVAPRNPIRAETVFECGGTLCADGSECVAFVNGRIVKRGSAFGPFVVSLVSPQAVVLSFDGDLLVIPRGRRVTVEH